MKTPQELNELADRLELMPWFASDDVPKQAAHELRHMAQLQADLHEAAELLRETGFDDSTTSAIHDEVYAKAQQWRQRRDSLLAKISTVAPETKTTT